MLGELAAGAIAYFGASAQGNFEGANVLEARGEEAGAAGEIRALLLEARSQRPRPALDDKRLCAWNALMIAALAEAGATLNEPRYLGPRSVPRSSCWGRMRDADGRCCGPTTAARRACLPISRITRSCSKRCYAV